MKIFLIFQVILLCIFLSMQNIYANTLIEAEFQGHKIKFIEYNIGDPDFDIQIGIDKKGGSEVLEIAQDIGAITGINGVFECPKDYTECGGKNFTINERYVEGEKIYTYDSTGARVVFAWDENTNPFLFQTDNINPEREDEIWEGFANFPLLLKDGEPQIEQYIDLGLVDSKMTGVARRSFICSNESGDKIYFGHVYNIGVDWMSLLLKDFGCYNALNLDAGYSTAFVYNGKYMVGPGRDILDGVFIVPKNIDTGILEIKIDNVLISLEQYLSKKTWTQKYEFKEKLQAGLNSLSASIYEKNSTEYIKDGVIIGEETNVTSISTLKKLYIINRLRDEIKKL